VAVFVVWWERGGQGLQHNHIFCVLWPFVRETIDFVQLFVLLFVYVVSSFPRCPCTLKLALLIGKSNPENCCCCCGFTKHTYYISFSFLSRPPSMHMECVSSCSLRCEYTRTLYVHPGQCARNDGFGNNNVMHDTLYINIIIISKKKLHSCPIYYISLLCTIWWTEGNMMNALLRLRIVLLPTQQTSMAILE